MATAMEQPTPTTTTSNPHSIPRAKADRTARTGAEIVAVMATVSIEAVAVAESPAGHRLIRAVGVAVAAGVTAAVGAAATTASSVDRVINAAAPTEMRMIVATKTARWRRMHPPSNSQLCRMVATRMGRNAMRRISSGRRRMTRNATESVAAVAEAPHRLGAAADAVTGHHPVATGSGAIMGAAPDLLSADPTKACHHRLGRKRAGANRHPNADVIAVGEEVDRLRAETADVMATNAIASIARVRPIHLRSRHPPRIQ
mmetsp:Transcript_14312/g.40716  ORF Transcript_14312/g.40716 Transcript_14312/m.40716 type:complete len:258 (-) Transcript_14312:488-1261(-)